MDTSTEGGAAFELHVSALLRIDARFTPDAVAWPADYSPERIAAETRALYRADPAALLDSFGVTDMSLTVEAHPKSAGTQVTGASSD